MQIWGTYYINFMHITHLLNVFCWWSFFFNEFEFLVVVTITITYKKIKNKSSQFVVATILTSTSLLALFWLLLPYLIEVKIKLWLYLSLRYISLCFFHPPSNLFLFFFFSFFVYFHIFHWIFLNKISKKIFGL